MLEELTVGMFTLQNEKYKNNEALWAHSDTYQKSVTRDGSENSGNYNHKHGFHPQNIKKRLKGYNFEMLIVDLWEKNRIV